jgi:ABC-type Fe3+-hydroxamate transport system substrate-binding protein
MPRTVDSLGRELRLGGPPQRIVSLVPSLTETLFALGCGTRLVGVTDFCVHPAEGVAAKARVGGTKNPALAAIAQLRPDLVLANKEENRRRDVERLERAGVPVWVGDARDVSGAIAEVRALGRLCEAAATGEALAARLETALRAARAGAPVPPVRCLALIWKAPYMGVGPDTFASDLLAQCGGANVLSAGAGARRYPRLDAARIGALAPELILLPTEPYAFAEEDRRELLALDCAAARAGQVHVVEGELLTWYGPRIARALEVFGALLRAAARGPAQLS